MQTALGKALDSRAMKSPVRELRLPLWSRPGYLIRRLHQIHVALFLEECKDWGLTPVQYGLLTALTFRGALDQGSLAEEFGLDRTSTAEVLARLEKRRLVTRKPNPRDRRARLARITARGRALTAATFSSMQRAQDRVCAHRSARRSAMYSWRRSRG